MLVGHEQQMEASSLVGELVGRDTPVLGRQQNPLLRMAGQVVTREILVQDVLGRVFSPFDRSIDTHVSNLRRKLGLHPDGTERIKGVRGVGYLYAIPRQPRSR